MKPSPRSVVAIYLESGSQVRTNLVFEAYDPDQAEQILDDVAKAGGFVIRSSFDQSREELLVQVKFGIDFPRRLRLTPAYKQLNNASALKFQF